MISNSSNGLQLFHFGNLSDHRGVRHFVTSRVGGFGAAPFDSLNLGYKTADDPANVTRNRLKLADTVGIPLNDFVLTKQVHENRVAVITAADKGRGAFDYASGMDETDALVTNQQDICLMVLLADCTPILLYDPEQRVVAAIHSGWKSTVKQIARETVDCMVQTFGSSPTDILAGIGPAIGPCCFQVGQEVVNAVHKALGSTDGLLSKETTDGKVHLDLWETNRRLLLALGIPEESIEVAGICTKCRSDLFFSERHHPGTGRFGAGIMLRDEMCASCTNMHCTQCRE